MTFESTAWAINGSLLGSELARRAQFAAVGGAHGIVQKADLKVTQLGVPGVGILIAPGVGLLQNDYQTTPNETYVVSNPGSHTVPSTSMPASNPSARSYIVAVTVGDPDFSQIGHPWMGSDDPPLGEETTFEYVRPILVPVSAGATSLNVDYPALVLARIDIPGNTTTITNAMITDLRTLAQPRQSQEAFTSPAGTWVTGSAVYIPVGNGFAEWGTSQYAPSVRVPSWASRAIVIAHINGVRYKDTTVNIRGRVRAKLGAVSGTETVFDYEVEAASARRANLMCAGTYDVSGIAGTLVSLKIEGYQDSPAAPVNDQALRLQSGSQVIYDVRFFEE